MMIIDGSARSGSGTIARYSVALASLLGLDIGIVNIRALRDKPGLRAQHLKVVQACSEICRGSVKYASVGSKSLRYTPGERFTGGDYSWDIGTAGSAIMMAETLLPIACFARRPSRFRIEGGLFQDFAPTAYHMKFVLLPLLERMGIEADVDIIRPGYVPKGGGIIEMRVEPVQRLKPLVLTEQGEIINIKGMALSSHLKAKIVSRRMAEECRSELLSQGYECRVEEIEDDSALQEGAALAIYAEMTTGSRIGSDRAGSPGRSSESIGRYVAQTFLEDVDTGAAVDRYAADQLIIYAALAEGITRYSVPCITDHIDTNLWLVEQLLGARTTVNDGVLEIAGVGFR
ncbi:MAG: RNA 3'-terminal phosphate cyclase [Dehalococcoidia bacterium]